MLEVRLSSDKTRGYRVAFVREPTGRDEMLLDGHGPAAATALLDRLLVDAPGAAVGSGHAWDLPLFERDRLVAAVHARCFGDRIDCSLKCTSCAATFDANFSLAELLEHVMPSASKGAEGPDENGYYTASDGTRFRLPTASDERAVSFLPAEEGAAELLRRCTEARSPSTSDESIQSLMEVLGPVLDVELPLSCGACGKSQKARFDVVSFFTEALRRERALLAREIHSLAAAYHWSLDDILRLPRSARRNQVALVEAARSPQRGRR